MLEYYGRTFNTLGGRAVQNTDWLQVLLDAVNHVKDRLPLAMTADGCREAWLQAEIMMYAEGNADYSIWTNTEPVIWAKGGKPGGQKYDLASYEDDGAVTMVGEVKIIGWNFQHKCIFGRKSHLLRELMQEKADSKCFTAEQVDDGERAGWSLIEDAARLMRHPCKNKCLLLVILDPKDTSKLTAKQRAFHKALHRIQFENLDHKTEKFGDITVKVWMLPEANSDL
jgi:hypothetical protein